MHYEYTRSGYFYIDLWNSHAMERTTIGITKNMSDHLETIKVQFGFTSAEDVVAYLLDLYLSVPSEVPRDKFYAMRKKYITDYPEEFFATVLDLQGIKEPEVFVKAFEEIMADRIEKHDTFIANGVVFECHHCGHVWKYGGKNDMFGERISLKCPACKYRIPKKDARSISPLFDEAELKKSKHAEKQKTV